MRRGIFNNYSRLSGFSLISVMVAGVVGVIVIMGSVRLLQSTYKSQRIIKKNNDFDTAKLMVKAVLGSRSRCKESLRKNDNTPIQFDPTLDTPVAVDKLFVSQNNSLYVTGASLGGGLSVSSMSIQKKQGTDPENVSVSEVVNGVTVNQNLVKTLVEFSMVAHSSDNDQTEYRMEPSIPFYIYTQPGTNTFVNCYGDEGSGQSGQQVCENLGGIWANDTCSINQQGQGGTCPAGEFVNQIDGEGRTICARPAGAVYQ